MILLLTAVAAVSVACFVRVLARGETFVAGLFLTAAVICGVWASHLHVPGMRDFVPGPMMAFGILLFCGSCGVRESAFWNWLISPLGQAIGGGLTIVGLIMASMCIAW